MQMDLPSGSPEIETHPELRCREVSRPSDFVRRRGSLQQGRALETLGHAVEYLVDSRLFQVEELNQRDEQEAVQILMRLSRAVFMECPEVITLRRRFGRWLAERLVREPDAHEGHQG